MRITGFFLLLALFATTVITQEVKSDFSESAPYAPRVFPAMGPKKEGKKDGDKTPQPPAGGSVVDLNLVLPVSVLDSRGRLVLGLKKEDFTVFVDGRSVEIDSVENGEGPLDLVLLIDVSPSTDSLLDTVKSLATRFVGNLGPNDRGMVASFAKNLDVRTDFTSDKAIITKAIQKLEMGDGTSLYTSIAQLVSTKIKPPGTNVSLIVFTDGVDTVSRKFDYRTSLEAVERTGITVFPVYFDTFEALKKLAASRNTFPIPIPRTSPRKEDYDMGRFYLVDLVLLSGGRAFVSGANIAFFDSIPAQLRSRYLVKLRLRAAPSGVRLPIKMRINRAGLTLQVKGSIIN